MTVVAMVLVGGGCFDSEQPPSASVPVDRFEYCEFHGCRMGISGKLVPQRSEPTIPSVGDYSRFSKNSIEVPQANFEVLADDVTWVWNCAGCTSGLLDVGEHDAQLFDAPVGLFEGSICSIHGCPLFPSLGRMEDDAWIKSVVVGRAAEQFPNIGIVSTSEVRVCLPGSSEGWFSTCSICFSEYRGWVQRAYEYPSD